MTIKWSFYQFLSKIVVQWGEFLARGGGLPLISSVGKPWDIYNFGGRVYQGDFPGGKEMIYEKFSGGKIFWY